MEEEMSEDKRLQRELEAENQGLPSEDYYDNDSPCKYCSEDTCYGCELVPEELRPK